MAAYKAIYDDIEDPKKMTGIFQLMPCYSMPQYAHFHPKKVVVSKQISIFS